MLPTSKNKKKFSFKKSERLCHKPTIESLFKDGISYFSYPFKVVYLSQKHTEENQEKTENNPKLPSILIVVPKRIFKKASTRNLIKRRIKEAYRLHKENSFNPTSKQYLWKYVAFIFVGKEIMEYKEIEERFILLLKKLKKSF
jgi:ribonuclease P protein component